MKREIINTTDAPTPIGPYNQAISIGESLYVSGQVAIDPATETLISGDAEEQTKLVLSNIASILKAAGLNFSHVVKSSIFIADMNDFGGINAVYASKFDPEKAPARETVEVSKLPKDARVEISMIAVK